LVTGAGFVSTQVTNHHSPIPLIHDSAFYYTTYCDIDVVSNIQL
jgi:hypothetical protein